MTSLLVEIRLQQAHANLRTASLPYLMQRDPSSLVDHTDSPVRLHQLNVQPTRNTTAVKASIDHNSASCACLHTGGYEHVRIAFCRQISARAEQRAEL
jgi:hypothetical protein